MQVEWVAIREGVGNEEQKISQGKNNFVQEKVSEKAGNFISD